MSIGRSRASITQNHPPRAAPRAALIETARAATVAIEQQLQHYRSARARESKQYRSGSSSSSAMSHHLVTIAVSCLGATLDIRELQSPTDHYRLFPGSKKNPSPELASLPALDFSSHFVFFFVLPVVPFRHRMHHEGWQIAWQLRIDNFSLQADLSSLLLSAPVSLFLPSAPVSWI
jgi:hypothetical protein